MPWQVPTILGVSVRPSLTRLCSRDLFREAGPLISELKGERLARYAGLAPDAQGSSKVSTKLEPETDHIIEQAEVPSSNVRKLHHASKIVGEHYRLLLRPQGNEDRCP